MHKVSAFIRSFVRQHLEQHGIVVWYDPEGIYRPLVETGWEGVRVLYYEGSFLALRRAADEALEAGSTPERLGERFPPLLIYLPLARSASQNALIELETAGVVLGPEECYDTRSDSPRDTRLAALAREALKKHLPAALLEQVVAEVEAGKLGLEDLDNLVRPPEVPVGLTTFYQAQTPEAVALAFVTGEDRDADLVARGLLSDLKNFFREHFGMAGPLPPDAARVRAFVVRHLLVTEAAVASGTAEHPVWQGFPVVASPGAQALAVRTVQSWRRDRNLSENYRHWAHRVAQELALPLADLPDEALAVLETFVQAEEIFWERLAETLSVEGHQEEVRRRVQRQALGRLEGFWAQQDSLVAQRWRALVAAVAVFDAAAEAQRMLRKGRVWKVEELVTRYADRERGWYRLDQAYRHFEVAREALLDLPPKRSFSRLESTVRRLYRDTVHRMAERLVDAWQRTGLETLENVAVQREVFRRAVLPLLKEGKRVAYILVDALRYELVVEFLDRHNLGDAFVDQVHLEPVVGSLPGVTVLGMAAALPGAEGSLGLVEDRGELAAEVDGRTLRTQDDRVRFLEERLQAARVELFAHRRLEELYAITDRDLEKLREAEFILVTSQEIDLAAENMGPSEALDQFRRVLRHLWRVLRRLAETGIEHVIVTADHGFLLFGDSVEDAEKMESPAGETLKVGRRYWVGRGGGHGREYAWFSAADLGLTGDLEFSFPRGVGVFRAPGAHNHYFHGGISLQEAVIPLLHLKLRVRKDELVGRVEWKLEPAVERLTSRMLRVTIRAEARELFRSVQRVRLEVRIGGEQVVPQILVTSCGYDELLDVLTIQPGGSEMGYPPCEVTLVFTNLPSSGKLELILVNADTGVRLAGPISLPIDVAIR